MNTRKMLHHSQLITGGLLVALAVTACSPLPQQPAPAATTATSAQPVESATPAAPALTAPAERAVAAVAAQLGIAPDTVKVVSAEQVDWPDGCLGVYQPDVMCTQAIVPGYRIVLEAAGQQYEVHTDLAGRQVLLAPSVQTGPTGAMIEQALRQTIALRLGLRPIQVNVLAVEPMTWPDACLGAGRPDESCALVETPGYRLVVEAKDMRYTFHTDETGAQVRAAPLSTGETALINKLRDLVAVQLGITADAVTATAIEAVNWPDACLGVQKPDLVCAQVLTPGFRVTLEAAGGRFVFHTDETGASIMLAEQITPQ